MCRWFAVAGGAYAERFGGDKLGGHDNTSGRRLGSPGPAVACCISEPQQCRLRISRGCALPFPVRAAASFGCGNYTRRSRVVHGSPRTVRSQCFEAVVLYATPMPNTESECKLNRLLHASGRAGVGIGAKRRGPALPSAAAEVAASATADTLSTSYMELWSEKTVVRTSALRNRSHLYSNSVGGVPTVQQRWC
jgi:hypothetical protein